MKKINKKYQTKRETVVRNYELLKEIVPEMFGGSKSFHVIRNLSHITKIKKHRIEIWRERDTVVISKSYISPVTSEKEFDWIFILWLDESRGICWVRTTFENLEKFFEGSVLEAIDEPEYCDNPHNSDGGDVNEAVTFYMKNIIDDMAKNRFPYFERVK